MSTYALPVCMRNTFLEWEPLPEEEGARVRSASCPAAARSAKDAMEDEPNTPRMCHSAPTPTSAVEAWADTVDGIPVQYNSWVSPSAKRDGRFTDGHDDLAGTAGIETQQFGRRQHAEMERDCVPMAKGGGYGERHGEYQGARAREGRPETTAMADPTTLMLRNIPARCTVEELLAAIGECGFEGKFDFMYLPMTPGKRMNKGYGFVAFPDADQALEFSRLINGWSIRSRTSDKTIAVEVAKEHVRLADMPASTARESWWGPVLFLR